jgi:gamma-glutamylcyclotransferase
VIYFAYGSNMLTQRLQERTPSARVICKAIAHGWKLGFNKKSSDGSGKCGITQDGESSVHGVLFKIAESQVGALDMAEGVGHGYTREKIPIKMADGQQVPVDSYLPSSSHLRADLRPYDWYLQLVIAGAMEHLLPDHWILSLKQIEATPDPKPDRKERLKALSLLTEPK